MSPESVPRVDVSGRPTPRRPHRPPAPVTSALFKPDRPRRIDRYIDYFGGDAAARTPSGAPPEGAGAARDDAAPGAAGGGPARVRRVRAGRRACPARVGR